MAHAWFWLIMIAALLFIVAYFLFRDTLNKIQYVEWLHIYWIVKDDGREHAKYQPRFMKSFMRQTSPPYWYGDGWQIRMNKWTIQAGFLQGKKKGAEFTVGENGWLPTDPARLERFEDDTDFDFDV